MSGSGGLQDKHALVIGLGARGTLVAAYLAAAGVGRIGLIDGAFVEEGDLGRGPLTFRPDLGAGKADGLAVKLGLIDAGVHAEPFPAFLDAKNADLIVQGADVVIDCTDNDAARLLVNDASLRNDVALVSGAVSPEGGWWKRVVVGSCLRAFIDDSEQDEDEGSSTAVVEDETFVGSPPAQSGVIASLQAVAATQFLQSSGEIEPKFLHSYEVSTGNWTERAITCSDDCICAGGSAAGNV